MFTTLNQIKKLRPEFKFGAMVMVDWFEVYEGKFYCTIKSGLKHADGETRSFFHYEETAVGKNAKKIAIAKFNHFWCSKFNLEFKFDPQWKEIRT
jgi:hypothetical protein